MDIGVITGVLAVVIAAFSLILSGRKDTRENAAGTARLEAKLDSISSGVEDIRVETRTMRTRVDGLAERMSAVESSVKSAHHRLDQMKTHQPD